LATDSSIWYRWTPAESGTAVFDFAANFPAVSSVYNGSTVGNLSRIAQAGGSRLTFFAIAGSTYHIAVGSTGHDFHRAGIHVHIWTVNEIADMERLLDWGVDGLVTDRPDRLAQVLHRRYGRALPPGLTH
jgi:hypothetical protein